MTGMNGAGDVIIEDHDSEEAGALLDVVNGLYREVFSLPPFNATEAAIQHQREYFPKVAARPGFRLTLARSSVEGHVGFGYGYVLPADSSWWGGILEPLDEGFTRETGDRTFAVIDYGVLSAWRGSGVGRAVHNGLLSGAGAERATLSVRPTAVLTQAIYRHWGWRKVGHKMMDPVVTSPVFDILVLEEIPRPSPMS